MSERGPLRPAASNRGGMSGVSRAVKVRAVIAVACVTLLLGGLGWKAWTLQVRDAEALRQRALRQHVHTMEIPAPRGAILDARGRPLAVSADAASVYVNPREIVDVVGTAERLATLLKVDAATLEARLSSRKAFAWIERHVSPAEAEAVRAAALPGVTVAAEPRRWYPGRASGGPLLGFAGIDGVGLDGLELRFDKALTGTRAAFAALRDARGRTAMADGVVDAVPGATLHLTIDRAIQSVADAALADAIALHKAKSGVVVVLDVATGAVLAMASSPSYDPNEPGNAVALQARNRAVTDVFEIGSIMKVFTLGAALDARVTRADEPWDIENGVWRFAGKTIRDTHHDAVLTTAGVLKRSSNVGSVKIGLRVGRERLYAALKRYGFGARTGIELPHEEPGTVRDGSRWRDIELATIAFGYGITVTPLQVAAAMAAVADGGRWHTPHVVDRIVAADGAVLHQPTVETRQVFEPSTAAALRPMLESVFDNTRGESGTAGSVYVEGFRAGGKTATAHKIDPATKRYGEKLYLSSFAGIAPMDAPRISVVVVIDEPGGKDYFGGKVAGPVFAKVVSETLRYLGVPGSTPINAPKAAPGADAAGADATGADAAEADAPEAEVALPPMELDEAVTGGGERVTVPDFRGLGIAAALERAREAGVTLEITGSGRAVAQGVPPGPAPAGVQVRVEFADSLGISP
jgi:cell division protein FtsI (penicillin-binding protein 3)